MLCENCNHACPEGSRFCPMCGTPLPEAAPDPATDIPVSAPEDEVSGESLPVEAAPPEVPTEDPPAEAASVKAAPDFDYPPLPPLPPKKGSHLPPVLIMAGMFLVALILFLSTATGSNFPTYDTSTEIPWFEMDQNGLVTFVASEYSGSWEITIPETLNGRTVTGLAEGCFAWSDVVTVELPDTVNTIGSSAFLGCSSLRGIFLPSGVNTIEPFAFAGCSALEAICIPGTVTQIGEGAFQDSGKLRFVFYSGYYKGWATLYPDYICPHTYIICVDGNYLQGTEAP